MVKFIKTPQVRHRQTQSLAGVKIGSYIRTIRGRIAKVKNIYKKDIDTSKYADSERIENVYFFSCQFLDNKEILELEPHVTMSFVRVGAINLFFYKLYMFFTKTAVSESSR